MLKPGVWRAVVEAELFTLPTADSCQVKICDGQESGLPDPVLTLSLPDWTQKLKKKKKNWHCSSTVVSTFILHDNTAGEILMFCNSSNSELCLCDISVPRIPPPPLPNPVPTLLTKVPEARVTTKPQSSWFYSTWLPVEDVLFNLWSNLFEERLLWRLCLILLLIFVFLMLCLYAALH